MLPHDPLPRTPWPAIVVVFLRLSLLFLALAVFLGGCSYAPQEWLGRQLSGIDCRPEHLDARGRCVAYR
jgi:hypothetical protein